MAKKKKDLTFEFFTPEVTPPPQEEVEVIPNGTPIIGEIPIPYEPKRNNRWILELPEELGIDSWMVKSVPRPRLRARTEHINGGYDSPPFWIRFMDPIGPSVTQKLWDLYLGINNSNLEDDMVHGVILENLRTRFDGIRRNGVDMKLKMLDPTGVVVESWDIDGCRILDFDFGRLDYGDDSPSECGVKVKPTRVNLLF
jgi:hypothetical protein